jgi:hypothetical protein
MTSRVKLTPGQKGTMKLAAQDAEVGTCPTHDEHPVTDLSSWHEQIAMPKLDEIDAANSATHASSLTTITSSSPSSERRAM